MQNLHEDAADGQADQAQHADRFAPLVHEHDREREQKHRGGDDRDDGDREVKALEHDETARRCRRLARRKREHARQSRVHVARKRSASFGSTSATLTDATYSRRQGIAGSRHLQQIGQVEPYRARHLAEARRIRRRLVDAGDPEFARACARRIGREANHAADREVLGLGELTRDEDISWCLASCADAGAGDEPQSEDARNRTRSRRPSRAAEGFDPLPLVVGHRHHRQSGHADERERRERRSALISASVTGRVSRLSGTMSTTESLPDASLGIRIGVARRLGDGDDRLLLARVVVEDAVAARIARRCFCASGFVTPAHTVLPSFSSLSYP